MTLKEQTKQKIEDTKELILQMIPTRTSELINDTDYNYGYLDSNLILHLLNVNATLSSSQTIVSNGSTMTINALVADSDGNTVSNAPVQFYINGTASGNPINTDSNGIATYTYSGTGIGKTKVYAKIGTFLSEIYEVMDYILYDEGTSARHNDAMYDLSNTNLDFSRETEYTLISEKNTSSNTVVAIPNLPQSCIVDFEVAYVDGSMGNGFMTLNKGNTYKQFFSIQNLGYPTTLVTDFFRLRLSYSNGSATLTDLDNPTKTVTKTYTEYIDKIYFVTDAEIHSLKIRNVKIYNP